MTAGSNGEVNVWDLGGELILGPLPQGGFVRYAELSPDNRWIIAACRDNNARLLDAKTGELVATLNQETDPDDDDVGTFNTFRLTGTRGSDTQYVLYFGAHGRIGGSSENATDIRNGYIDGLTVDETCARGAHTRAALAGANREMVALNDRPSLPGRSYGILARARRSNRPGVVFARAAARGEVDPLEDVDARILCGLPVK